MRITAELIQYSPQFLNPIKDRELDLRGNKIPAIENLGATQDQFDTIDLSDNEIRRLENFPLLSRLESLYLNNNRISKIEPKLGQSLPKLKNLLLTNNYIRDLSDLDPLEDIPTLVTLSLMDNFVTNHENYRLYIIAKLPNLRMLDFKKVKLKERQEAEKLFPRKKEEKAPAAGKEKKEQKAKTFVPGAELQKMEVEPKLQLTPEQRKKIEDAILKATSVEQIARLESYLKRGELPKELRDKSSANAGAGSDKEEEDQGTQSMDMS